MDFHFSLDDVSQYTKRLGPAHIDFRVWPPPPDKNSVWYNARTDDNDRTDATEYGRSVMSTQKINSGKVVIQEYPQIKQLDNANVLHRCSQCFRRSADFKCRTSNCPWALHYCSKKCEARHWSSVHRWLCRFPELSKYNDMTHDNLKSHTGETPMMLAAYFFSNQSRIPSLVSNLSKHSVLDKKRYRDKARMVAVVLNLTRDNVVDELMEIQAQIRCNTIAIRETDADWGVNMLLGKAIYLSASMLNHSCDPNAIAFFGKDPGHDPCLLRIRASRDIPAQQQVCISYGFTAMKHEKGARRNSLRSRYFFNCKCEACQSGNVENPATHMYQCQNCATGRLAHGEDFCKRCNRRIDWMTIARVEQKADELVEEGQLVEALNLQDMIYHKSALRWGEAMDRLGQGYAQRGNYEKAAQCVTASLKAVGDTFGPTSIETSRELLKLATLLFNGHIIDNAKETVAEAIRVYKALGLDEQNGSEFKELQQMQSTLKHVDPSPLVADAALSTTSSATNSITADTTATSTKKKKKKK
ncbi:hypothetical protein BDB00DRAFT_924903 [Zychaea mexicana]|uniref:uncharacterized protein n=1 Tax=Zychaea mexicana TaxID=64656 RepID=UPI0022FE578C|nr:uncharacterized protein BDB00DRAFT_924903 [Zychaea mexicana]KAI9498588.1 hypothetical protein BDB00DRAFT_924903 [Zychaea mexicana]